MSGKKFELYLIFHYQSFIAIFHSGTVEMPQRKKSKEKRTKDKQEQKEQEEVIARVERASRVIEDRKHTDLCLSAPCRYTGRRLMRSGP